MNLTLTDLARAITCMDRDYRKTLENRISLARDGWPVESHDRLLHNMGETLCNLREAMG